MSFLLTRSVQLSTDTTNAWKAVGGQFLRRGRTMEETLEVARNYRFIVNLGKSSFAPTESILHEYNNPFVFNHGDNVKQLLWPGEARRLFGAVLPPRPTEFPASVWIKAPGMQGKGKYKKDIDYPLELPKEWDWQKHIEGTEYRIITVGNRIVQNLVRSGPNNDRVYNWLPMADVDRNLKRMVRRAAALLQGYNILAWDAIISDEGTFIFEANSCPGMSPQTAQRVVTEADRLILEVRNAS